LRQAAPLRSVSQRHFHPSKEGVSFTGVTASSPRTSAAASRTAAPIHQASRPARNAPRSKGSRYSWRAFVRVLSSSGCARPPKKTGPFIQGGLPLWGRFTQASAARGRFGELSQALGLTRARRKPHPVVWLQIPKRIGDFHWSIFINPARASCPRGPGLLRF